MAEHWPESVLRAMLAGQAMTGLSLSVTVTVKTQLTIVPATSVTNHSTVVLPVGKAELLGGPCGRVRVETQLSDEVTV